MVQVSVQAYNDRPNSCCAVTANPVEESRQPRKYSDTHTETEMNVGGILKISLAAEVQVRRSAANGTLVCARSATKQRRCRRGTLRSEQRGLPGSDLRRHGSRSAGF